MLQVHCKVFHVQNIEHRKISADMQAAFIICTDKTAPVGLADPLLPQGESGDMPLHHEEDKAQKNTEGRLKKTCHIQ